MSVGRTRAENSRLIRLSEIFCFPSRENIFAFPTTVRMSRKYEFLPQVNTLIRRSLEAGLFQKWRSDSSLYQNNLKQEQNCNVILTVAHIGGALLLLLCGLSLALLAFMAEWVVKMKIESCHTTKYLKCNSSSSNKIFFANGAQFSKAQFSPEKNVCNMSFDFQPR